MLMTIGRGIAPAASPSFAKKMTFTTSLPSEVSFTRASPATYMDANGALKEANANEPRFNHNEKGQKLGLMIEPPVTNKCINHNVNPTDTSGMVTDGDANGTLSVINDLAALAAAGLDQICSNGNVYYVDNLSGTSSFVVYINGGVGNLNPHSISLYARSLSSGLVFRAYIGDDFLDIQGDADWKHYSLGNQTPDVTNRMLKLTIPAGRAGYFILNQVEECPIATSVITTHGASASRAADRPYIDNLQNYDWFDESQGYMACRYTLSEALAGDAYPAVIHDGTSSNTIGIRAFAGTQDTRAYIRAGAANIFTYSAGETQIPHVMQVTGIRWNAGEAEIISNGSAYDNTITQTPSGLNRLEIGARNAGLSPIHGHIQSIEIGKNNIDLKGLGAKL